MELTVIATITLENERMWIKSCSLKGPWLEDSRPHTEGVPIIDLLRKIIQEARPRCSEKTSTNRITAVNALDRFFNEKMGGSNAITLDTVTKDHFRCFERWHIEKGYSRNYAACNMRNLRAIINLSLGKDRGKELFDSVRTTNSETRKRAVGKEVMQKINDLVLNPKSTEALVRDITIFQFRAMGMPLIDLAFARKSQLKNGHITYRRRKTNCQTSVLVTEPMNKILERLTPKDSDYLFPIITAEDPKEATRQYKCFLQKCNRTLGRISDKTGQNIRLTTYTPRHTWASIANEDGENMSHISQALAHTDIHTTQNYIKNISHEKIDEISRRVQAFLDE